MRVLSIDLPWSSKRGGYGFAWCELGAPTLAIHTSHYVESALCAPTVFGRHAEEHGVFDVILVDQPLGGAGPSATGHRLIERAFGNSSFHTNGGKRIQSPRFQPGSAHVSRGQAVAAQSLQALGTQSTIVVESFPQLSVVPLIDFAQRHRLEIGKVTGLKAHKVSGTTARSASSELLASMCAWTGGTISGDAVTGQADAVDAVLALLPLLDVLQPTGHGSAPAVWLHAKSPAGAPLPRDVPRSLKMATRAAWMSPLSAGIVGSPGVRVDGLLAMSLPGWPTPACMVRVL